MSAFEIYADEIVTPTGRSKLKRYRPGKLVYSSKTGKILEVGSVKKSQLPSRSRRRVRCLIPGLVDPHTHLVYGGVRADEWGERLRGTDYLEIARRGGGILSTVRSTRKTSEEELVKRGRDRLQQFLSFGVTTLEIKSGYGLDFKTELKTLRAIKKLQKKSQQELIPTFLGAHAFSKEYEDRSQYVDHIIESMLPKLKGLAEFQDVFCEKGNFAPKDSIRLLEAGKVWGLKPKVHAHEFGRTGGVEVAYRVGAISADHLHYMNQQDIERMKKANIIPVALPGTSFFLGAKKFAPSRKLIDSGLRLALATDFNPGTNPSMNLPLVGTFGAILEKMTLEEVLVAQTWHAALAVDRRDRGRLEPGFRADLVALEADSFEEMYYHYGTSLVSSVIVGGRKAY